MKLLAARASNAIEARLPVILGRTPIGGDGAFVFELEQKGIEGALIDGKQIAADLLDAACDAISVQRAERIERLQHHQRERALLNVFFLSHPAPL